MLTSGTLALARGNDNPTFNVNPIEKWLEALEEIKRLNAELLKAKDKKIEVLEKLLKDK